MSERGKVWLVGAGPADFGLFTIKGLEVLKKAQVVVYDHLVGTEILMQIPEDAEAIDVGKQAGHHKKTQEEINSILLQEALKGKRVVRLKGGDPFLFGRGGEELELLAEHKIPFEVVPGVTSALAVPAYSGIPATHRELASSVHIITGHRKDGEPLSIDFKALVRAGGTLVFLMGVKSLPEIVGGLMAAGMRGDTPAAVLARGTCAGQEWVQALLEGLLEAARRRRLGAPAVIVVGPVCALADRFSWYEELPLFGEKIVITRPRDRNSRLAEKLRGLGAETVSLPSIETVPVRDEASCRAVEEAMERLGEYDVFVFTSAYGVKRFFELLEEYGRDIRELGKGRLAAIGPATARALRERGLKVDLVPEQYDGRALGRTIARQFEENARILIPRAREGSEGLLKELAAAGRFAVTDLAIYETKRSRGICADLEEQIEDGRIRWVMFTSASTVHGFAGRFPAMDFSHVRAVCIGAQTAAAAGALGMQTFVSEEATVDSMVERILSLHRENAQGRERV